MTRSRCMSVDHRGAGADFISNADWRKERVSTALREPIPPVHSATVSQRGDASKRLVPLGTPKTNPSVTPAAIKEEPPVEVLLRKGVRLPEKKSRHSSIKDFRLYRSIVDRRKVEHRRSMGGATLTLSDTHVVSERRIGYDKSRHKATMKKRTSK